jgi:hypothetical protein
MIYHDMKEICILFRNQLKSFIQTVENTPQKGRKNQNKTSMDKAIGPLRDSRAPPWLRGTRSDVPAETVPLIGFLFCAQIKHFTSTNSKAHA